MPLSHDCYPHNRVHRERLTARVAHRIQFFLFSIHSSNVIFSPVFFPFSSPFFLCVCLLSSLIRLDGWRPVTLPEPLCGPHYHCRAGKVGWMELGSFQILVQAWQNFFYIHIYIFFFLSRCPRLISGWCSLNCTDTVNPANLVLDVHSSFQPLFASM